MALEGGVCCGKTTTADLLKNADDISLLKEYMDVLPASHNAHKVLMPFEERFPLFLSLEKDRWINPPFSKNGTVADRCIFTILAFEYAASSIGIASEVLSFASSAELKIKIPDVVICLNISETLRLKRWAKRGFPLDSLLVDRTFNVKLYEYYERVQRATRIHHIWADHLGEPEIIRIAKQVFYGIPADGQVKEMSLAEIIKKTYVK